MNVPQNFLPAMMITLFAGLATSIGGAIAFVVKKNSLKALSVGLGFSAGVMIFLSFTDMLPEADKLLAANFGELHKWLTFLGFVIGLIILAIISTKPHFSAIFIIPSQKAIIPISENATLTDNSAPESIAFTTSDNLPLIAPATIETTIKK